MFKVSLIYTTTESFFKYSSSRYHVEREAGNWLTTDIIQLLDTLSTDMGSQSVADLRLCSFSLVEKSTGTVTAITFGFGHRGVFEDYTMCTLKKDKRSCGMILTKLVGYILQQLGYVLWYWGYEVEYMKSYSTHYGARHIDRLQFYEILAEAKASGFLAKPFSEITMPMGVSIELCEECQRWR